MGQNTEKHEEEIICPECGRKQVAVVEHTIPFYTYIHECIYCEEIITESDWKNNK